MLKVAPWVAKEEKKTLRCSIVGFPKSKGDEVGQRRGRGLSVIWIQLLFEEVEDVLACVEDPTISLFVAMGRWMEIRGCLPHHYWICLIDCPYMPRGREYSVCLEIV